MPDSYLDIIEKILKKPIEYSGFRVPSVRA